MNKRLRKFAAPGRWLLCLVLAWMSTACTAKEETVGVGLTGIDHLAAHLSIQNYWVNGTSGHQADGGGRTVCCVSLPSKWRPGLTVHVKWSVTNWKRRVHSYYGRDVRAEQCDGPISRLWLHFLANGDVRAITCDIGPAIWEPNLEYPGPQPLAELPRKQPWDLYQRRPDEPTFPRVLNATEDP